LVGSKTALWADKSKRLLWPESDLAVPTGEVVS
jgi:hypothetical protein